MTSTRRALLYLMAVGACALQALAQSPPIANAGVDARATIGQEVTVDGSLSSDPDGLALSYWWSFEMLPDGSGATLSDPTAVTPTFTVDVPGDYVLSLVVNNGELDSAPDFVTVSVFNNPPVADAGPALFPRVGDAVTLDGTLSFDPDFDRLSYQWSFRLKPDCSRAILSTATSDAAEFVADCPGTYTVQLTVDDGVATSTASAIVQTVNSPPVANAGPDQTAAIGQPVHLNGSPSSDLDGSPLTYSWAFLTRPIGSVAALTGAQTAFPMFTPDRPGGYRLRLVVNDGVFNSLSDIVAISTVNTAPVADAGRDLRRSVGDLARLDGSRSTDEDGQTLRYTWSLITRPPDSFTALDNPSAIRPLLVIDAPGTYVARLTVHDGLVSSVADTVRISTANAAPVADAGPDILAERGKTVQLNGSRSTDVDGDDLGFRWALVSKPTGSATILFNVAAVRPALVPDLAGDYIVQLVATDGRAISAPDSILITTRNVAPTADAGPDQSIQTDLAAVLDGTGSRDANNDALTYHWAIVSRPLGSNAAIQSGVPIASLMPDVEGIYVVSLEVSDGVVASAPDTVVISTPSFNAVPVALPQRAEGESDVEIGTAVTLDGLSSGDADFNILSYRWSLIVRPRNSRAELSDPASPTPVVTADVVGTYVAQLIVNDFRDPSPPATLMLIAVPRRNHPPIADAGPDQFAIPFQLVQLDGRGSHDPDPDDILLFAWTLTTPVGCDAASMLLPDRNSPIPTFVPLCVGDYIATLVVGDGQLSSLPSNVTISVGWPLVTIAATDAEASEAGPDEGKFTVTRTGSVERDLFVSYTVSGTAQNGVDYNPIAGSVLIPAGDASSPIVILPIPDDLVEGDETVVVALDDGAEYDIGDPRSATVTIHDDDQPSISITDAVTPEGDVGTSSMPFTVTLNSPGTQEVTVDFTTESGTAIGGPLTIEACPDVVPKPDGCLPDFVPATGTIRFQPGQTVATIDIQIIGDLRLEADETFRVVLSNATNATLGVDAAIGTIVNDDAPPTLSIAAESTGEGDSGTKHLVFTVIQSGLSGLPTTVEVGTADASATAPSDYTPVALTINIPAGVSSASVPVPIIGDTAFEPDETFVVTLANPVNATLLIGEAVGTIVNDDNAPVVTIEASDPDAEEGVDTRAFTFTRAGDMSATLSVSFTVGGTATNGEDFALIAPPVIIPAGESSVVVIVAPTDDSVVEGDETVVVTLETGVNYHVGAPGSATVTIADRRVPIVTIMATDPVASEVGDDTGTFTITRLGDPTFDLTVDLLPAGGTATFATDYQLAGNLGQQVTIPAGQASTTVIVTAIPDAIVEGNETVVLTLSDGAAYDVGAAGEAMVTIEDMSSPLVVSPNPLNFDDQQILTRSAPRRITVRNAGIAPVHILIPTLSAGPFEIAFTNCRNLTLTPSLQCAIDIVVLPPAIGRHDATLSIPTDVAGTFHVALSANGVPPVVQVTPNPLDFGDQQVDTRSVSRRVIVRNAGIGPVRILVPTLSTDPFEIAFTNCQNLTLTPALQCAIDIVATPPAAGPHDATLSIPTDVAGTFHVALSANGVPPIVQVTPNSLDLGDQQVDTRSVSRRVIVRNAGIGPVRILIPTLSTGPFEIAFTNCQNLTLTPSLQCAIDIVVTPPAMGPHVGALSIPTNVAGTFEVTLSVNGVQTTPELVTWALESNENRSPLEVPLNSRLQLKGRAVLDTRPRTRIVGQGPAVSSED